jgi:ADP-ribose pyrophosphatase
MTLRRRPDVEVFSSRTLFEGRVFDVVRESLRLPSGLRQDLEIVDHPGAVAVAAVDEDGRLLLVRQYRHAAGDWLVEVPAGRVEPGEARADAARRELEEETGFKARSFELLSEFYAAPGFCSELLSLYVARDLYPAAGDAQGSRARMDDDEEIELVRLFPDEILAGAARDAKTLLAALLVRQRKA